MPLLQMELVELEVEPLEVIEFPRPEQNSNLETLTTSKGEFDSTGVMILKGLLPTNDNCCCCGQLTPAPECPCGGYLPNVPIPCVIPNDKRCCCGCCPNTCYCC
jgi:hypothetical protein